MGTDYARIASARAACLTDGNGFRGWLGLSLLRNWVDAKVALEQWRRRHNEARPHSSLQHQTPAELKAMSPGCTDHEGRWPAMPARTGQEEYGDDRLDRPSVQKKCTARRSPFASVFHQADRQQRQALVEIFRRVAQEM